ncbi:MAG: AIR carboxylase family protein, partial [Deltaproteobacteria bacterium]|nr:AIR carboxylase family protein [Deltaproteobacteria bacterium]
MQSWAPATSIDQVYTPQLELLHRGKVRDSFRLDAQRRLIVVTDRISAFDLKIKTPVPGKGEILNRLAAFWFERTADVVANHVVSVPDGQAMVVRECAPIRVEMVVRGAICGTLWRAYKSGRRTFSGVHLPEGLTENARLPGPIVTPTTKEDSDREVTPAECVALGLVSEAVYAQMDRAARALFAFGAAFAQERGLLLADTKYEFGLCDGQLVLIDEIHTPDSSRFFDLADWQASPTTVGSYDKEFVRKWMRANAVDGRMPLDLPDDVVRETAARYAALYQRLTGAPVPADPRDPKRRLYDSLVGAGLLRDGYVAIIMGSRADLAHAETIAKDLRKSDVAVDLRVLSAHKNGDRAVAALVEYNNSLEPGAIVAIAGESNGLGGALAANTNLPVINCPPFKDDADYLVNIHSSLRMPRHVPAATVVKPALAAQAALRSLNLPRLRALVAREVAAVRDGLASDDGEVRAKG